MSEPKCIHGYSGSGTCVECCNYALATREPTKKLREFWIENKKFVDEWIYEAFETKEACPNKGLVSIQVREVSPAHDAMVAKMAEALELSLIGKPETGLDNYVLIVAREALALYNSVVTSSGEK